MFTYLGQFEQECGIGELTNPCIKQTRSDATFDRRRRIRIGISGFVANFVSWTPKTKITTTPKTIQQVTFGERHGLMIPPRFRPRRIIKLSPRINAVPNQSIAFVPWIRPVRGLCTCRQKYNTITAKPDIGRLIHQFHLQETYSVKAPPRRGPTPLARLQTTPVSPKYNPRSLNISLVTY